MPNKNKLWGGGAAEKRPKKGMRRGGGGHGGRRLTDAETRHAGNANGRIGRRPAPGQPPAACRGTSVASSSPRDVFVMRSGGDGGGAFPRPTVVGNRTQQLTERDRDGGGGQAHPLGSRTSISICAVVNPSGQWVQDAMLRRPQQDSKALEGGFEGEQGLCTPMQISLQFVQVALIYAKF